MVWNEEYVDLTITREGIGPYDTKPPECYIGFAYNIPDELQYAIDIYEFIKTMWMVLKIHNIVFMVVMFVEQEIFH